jgi:hypothetical protein
LTQHPHASNNVPEQPDSNSEIQILRAEITRLTAALATARLESANRLAAIRAALGAAADGEADPLAYLRDELPEGSPSPWTYGSCR